MSGRFSNQSAILVFLTTQSVLYLPVHSPGVWCIAIGATPVMDPWMHERHCVARIGTSIKICEIGLL